MFKVLKGAKVLVDCDDNSKLAIDPGNGCAPIPVGGRSSNVIIIENMFTDEAAMTVNGEVFSLTYEPVEDWHPVINPRLYTMLVSMFPDSMPTIYRRETDNDKVTYSPMSQTEIRISEGRITFDASISIANSGG